MKPVRLAFVVVCGVWGGGVQVGTLVYPLLTPTQAPAPGLVDEPLLIDSYHRLPDDVPKEKDRSCTNCTLV